MSLFEWGERVEGFEAAVINERDARASAGIMFLLGLLSLFSVSQLRTLFWAEFFSLTFIIEFIVRALNPKYAPYMLMGGMLVSNQTPEWVDAKPKRFAWFLGLILGGIMAFYIIFDVVALTRIAVCLICLTLLFLESALGICLGCHLYRWLNLKVERCPGGVCDLPPPRRFGSKELLVLAAFMGVFMASYWGLDVVKHSEVKRVVIIED